MKEKTRGLYLDDCRTPRGEIVNWSIVRSYDQFVEWIQKNGLPQIISFDHDLSIEHVKFMVDQEGKHPDDIKFNYDECKEKTGLHAAKWLTEYCEKEGLDLPLCTVHSANPAGGDNIVGHLNSYLKSKELIPNTYRTIW